MTHTQDEIRVGAVRLPWLKEKTGGCYRGMMSLPTH